MHLCLCINEILQLIADNINPENTKTLLHMALTCHAFVDPAMNALWRILPDPGHLIRILPEHKRRTSDKLKQLVSS